MSFFKKLGRKLKEPSTIAGAVVIGSTLFPGAGPILNVVGPILGGLLVGHTERKTLEATGYIKAG